ncbi:hypothetical protein BKA57DRAFT_445947 [Linnemannia elongata]|nr:hypothetical protein BKA57DRAFT_445947 [Linnemannia elongata]
MGVVWLMWLMWLDVVIWLCGWCGRWGRLLNNRLQGRSGTLEGNCNGGSPKTPHISTPTEGHICFVERVLIKAILVIRGAITCLIDNCAMAVNHDAGNWRGGSKAPKSDEENHVLWQHFGAGWNRNVVEV